MLLHAPSIAGTAKNSPIAIATAVFHSHPFGTASDIGADSLTMCNRKPVTSLFVQCYPQTCMKPLPSVDGTGLTDAGYTAGVDNVSFHLVVLSQAYFEQRTTVDNTIIVADIYPASLLDHAPTIGDRR